jgi:hypothetical protein
VILTSTEPDSTTSSLRFRRAVYIYDRDARQVDWGMDDDTVVQVYPASAPPGYLQNCTRVMVPTEVQQAVLDDFPALRRLAEIAEGAQPGAPIDHPTMMVLRHRLRILYVLIAVKTIAIAALIGVLLDRQ